MVNEDLGITSYSVQAGRFKATIFYEKEVTEEDKALLEKQIESLKMSIKKREGLLSNQGFVSKAPANLVEEEKKKLEEEKKLLESLEK